MRISDMTDTLFDREMQRILSDVQFWAIRLDNIGDFTLTPTPASYADGEGQQPFPLAIDLKEVWDYARGEGSCPREILEIIQSLCELLWCPVAAHTYEVPNAFWDMPLGFMCQLAHARLALDSGESLSVEQLAMLGDLKPARVRQLCQSGNITAFKKERTDNSQQEWTIPAEAAKEWLKSRFI